ncbi:MAG: septum formation protein Maf [Gammaproteobacteria bacterium GWE2_42_36]|nr:MAG: septum formation protein Maf [Gammaproteobacteria bacterium GWE2_42_36]HCU05856.1 septum formation protein Maf [Coxiellaceae bacterium]
MSAITPQIYLASSSPRRRDLLQQIGIVFKQLPVAISEIKHSKESPANFAKRMALEKAIAGWQHPQRKTNQPVLGADTIVVIGRSVLGKPKNRAEGIAMLQRLSGKTHHVLSAVALVQGKRQSLQLSDTAVTFRSLSLSEIKTYWTITDEPCDKAGSYGIQGLGGVFIKKISGSYTGVMGLPLSETESLLNAFGIYLLQGKTE